MGSDKPNEIPISDAISHGVPANDLRREAADQHGQITRWLFASLLAINGGAVLASAQLDVSAHQIRYGLSAFVMGIVLAVVSALCAREASRHLQNYCNLLARIAQQISYRSQQALDDALAIPQKTVDKINKEIEELKERRSEYPEALQDKFTGILNTKFETIKVALEHQKNVLEIWRSRPDIDVSTKSNRAEAKKALDASLKWDGASSIVAVISIGAFVVGAIVVGLSI